MKSRDSLVRLKEFQVNEKRRQLQQLQMMMSEFERMTKDLESQIVVEEKKSGISDPNHFAYPTFAKAAIQRRDNLLASAADLEAKLASARETLAEAFEELKRIELLEERDAERMKIEQARAAELGAVAGVPHRVAS